MRPEPWKIGVGGPHSTQRTPRWARNPGSFLSWSWHRRYKPRATPCHTQPRPASASLVSSSGVSRWSLRNTLAPMRDAARNGCRGLPRSLREGGCRLGVLGLCLHSSALEVAEIQAAWKNRLLHLPATARRLAPTNAAHHRFVCKIAAKLSTMVAQSSPPGSQAHAASSGRLCRGSQNSSLRLPETVAPWLTRHPALNPSRPHASPVPLLRTLRLAAQRGPRDAGGRASAGTAGLSRPSTFS